MKLTHLLQLLQKKKVSSYLLFAFLLDGQDSGSHVLYNSVQQNMFIMPVDAFTRVPLPGKIWITFAFTDLYLGSVQAFALAGLGGWKLHGIVKPNSRS